MPALQKRGSKPSLKTTLLAIVNLSSPTALQQTATADMLVYNCSWHIWQDNTVPYLHSLLLHRCIWNQLHTSTERSPRCSDTVPGGTRLLYCIRPHLRPQTGEAEGPQSRDIIKNFHDSHDLQSLLSKLGSALKKSRGNTFTLHNCFSLKFVQSSACLNARHINRLQHLAVRWQTGNKWEQKHPP